ncbi:MAG: ribosome biogenesis GTP-binding protein YihA/YsxC [Thermodesulfobacteriota bacterium]|nr:ribosome biogenesis GTP-binding protein YihA/YsxC [Thermodesulfobacteriota bacterium]
MNIKSAAFVASAVKPSQYPSSAMPEVAFAGRSNVGKSSLINGLLGRKNLVRTSSTPGHTQTINFFLINNGFHFVDLPGYGYAKVPIGVRKKWGPMVARYLRSREGLCAVVVILDVRRRPNEADHDLLAWLAHYSIPEIVVLTKADKLKRNKQNRQRGLIGEDLSKDPSSFILFSATTGIGKQALWKTIEARF